MPSVTCARCEGKTNSAISEYWTHKPFAEGIAHGCYAKWVNDHWERGCLYEQGSQFEKHMADDMINKGTDWGKVVSP